MTDGEVWIYLLSAFGTGLGLGWWLFGGTRAAGPPSSAAIARERASSRPPPLASVPNTEAEADGEVPAPTQEAPPPAVHQAAAGAALLQAELQAARRTAQEADARRLAAEEAVEASRLRQVKLQAHLDRAREARATLASELEQSKRTIVRLSQDSTPPAPTTAPALAASVAVAVAKAPRPPELERDAPTDLAPPKAPIPPFSLAPTVSVSRLSQAPSPRIPPPPPPKRGPKQRGPVEVLFGPLGGVPLTTDARSIPWELTIRLLERPDAPNRIRDVQVTLRFDLEDEGVAINGRRRGPLTVGRGGTVTLGRPLHVQVSLSTGSHSDTPDAERPPAVPGEHPVVIVVQYTSDRGQGTPASVRFSARIPVSAPTR